LVADAERVVGGEADHSSPCPARPAAVERCGVRADGARWPTTVGVACTVLSTAANLLYRAALR
jgi:hypothetical protein